jgi:DNA-binding NarL/FixJ family response regulator
MAGKEEIRVLVVDDHEAVLKGVARLVESEAPRLRIAGLARSGDEALRLASSTCPHVIVLDVLLDGENGLDLMPAFARAGSPAVVVLTSMSDTRARADALARGACAWVSKLAPAGELLAAIGNARAE